MTLEEAKNLVVDTPGEGNRFFALDLQFTISFAELGLLKPEWYDINDMNPEDEREIRTAIENYCWHKTQGWGIKPV